MKEYILDALKFLFKLISGKEDTDMLHSKTSGLTATVECIISLISAAIDRLIFKLKDIIIRLEEISLQAKDLKEIDAQGKDAIYSLIEEISAMKKKSAYKRVEIKDILSKVESTLRVIVG